MDRLRLAAVPLLVATVLVAPLSGVTGVAGADVPAREPSVLVSATPTGAAGDNASTVVAVSTDQRFLLIQSQADDLVPSAQDTQYSVHSYLADTSARTLVQLDVDANGVGFSGGSYPRAMSPDGRYLLYTGASRGTGSVLLDRSIGAAVHTPCDVLQCGSLSFDPAGTGFVFNATNTDGSLPGPQFQQGTFAFDLASRQVTSVDPDAQGNRRCVDFNARYGPGSWVYWNGCDPAYDPGVALLFRRNMTTGAVEVVSSAQDGTLPTGDTNGTAISADGRYAAFDSVGTGLVPGYGSGDGQYHPYLKDLTTGAVTALGPLGADYVTNAGILYDDAPRFTADDELLMCSNDPAVVPDGAGSVLIDPDGTTRYLTTGCPVSIAADGNSYVTMGSVLPDGTESYVQQVLTVRSPWADTPTTVSIVATANPATAGQTSSLVARVGPSGGQTGAVTFVVDGSAQPPVTLAKGRGTLRLPALASGPHDVRVVYNGDDTYDAAASRTLTQQITPAATRATLTSSANPSVARHGGTITAVVARSVPGRGTPTGTVTFTVDGVVGRPVALNRGVARLALNTVGGVGSHTVSAAYSGDAACRPAQSAVLVQQVTAG